MDIHNRFYGTAAAVITPFLSDGQIDFQALTRIIERNISSGLDYLVVLGSTGEAATLSTEEKESIKRHFISTVKNRLPLVLGMGGNDTAKLINEIRQTDLSGFDALLSVSPSYNKPSQQGIYEHYAALAKASPLPVILYNVPGRTGKNIEPETVFRLARDFDNIIGIKEAAGDMEQVLRLIAGKPEDFLIISGDDTLALSTVTAGGAGVISVIAQAFPKIFSSIIRAGLDGHPGTAFKQFYPLLPVIDLIFEEGNPTGIKQLLALQDLCTPGVRLPLTRASASLANKIAEQIKNLPDE